MPSDRSKTARAARHPSRAKTRAAPSWALRPVQWLRRLFKRKLLLQRRGLNLHVLLEPPPPPDTELAPPPSQGEALRRCHEELRALLARHPEVRHLMRHLGFLEDALTRSGSRALRSEVPVPVLRKALEQLGMLARDEPSEALSDLHQRIEVAIRERAGASAARRPAAEVTVSEASHSLFDEMERSWTGEMPLDAAPPPGR